MTVITGPLAGIVASCEMTPDKLKDFVSAAGQLMALAFAVAICYPLTLLGLKMEELRGKALKKTPPWIKKALACNAVVKKIASVDVESATPAVIKRIIEAAKKKLPRATPPNADAELGGEDEVTPAQFERFRSDANALYRSVGGGGARGGQRAPPRSLHPFVSSPPPPRTIPPPQPLRADRFSRLARRLHHRGDARHTRRRERPVFVRLRHVHADARR